MIKNCPVCGKAFDVLWPELWRYVRKNRYLCSWKCIRLYDKEKKEEEQMKKDNEPIKRLRMSKDDMAEAVRLWRENDPGLEQYLKDHGINHISKWKQNAKIRYREKPADYGQPIPGFGPLDEEPAATLKVDGPLKIETKEPEKVEVVETPEPATVKGKIVDVMEHLEIKNPLQYEEFTVREVEGLFGRYRRSDVSATYIDFENAEGCVDVMSYTVKQWNAFMKELKRAAQVLGVQLDV